MGVPNDPAFQKRVLSAALGLLEKESGPVLEDFPEDAPVSDTAVLPLSCPVSFPAASEPMSEPLRKCAALQNEISSIRPWYDLAVQKRKRTTVGVSGIEFDRIPEFLCAFLNENPPENPRDDLPLAGVLNLAVDDIKAFYTEAITAQPGQDALSSPTLSDWFWNETLAGETIFEIRANCKKSSDPFLRLTANVMLIPAEQIHKRKNRPE